MPTAEARRSNDEVQRCYVWDIILVHFVPTAVNDCLFTQNQKIRLEAISKRLASSFDAHTHSLTSSAPYSVENVASDSHGVTSQGSEAAYVTATRNREIRREGISVQHLTVEHGKLQDSVSQHVPLVTSVQNWVFFCFVLSCKQAEVADDYISNGN